MTTTTANPYALLTDAELDRYIERAWYEAVRAWNEARAYRAGAPDRRWRPADALLRGAAESADAYWHTLTDERRRRAAEEIEA